MALAEVKRLPDDATGKTRLISCLRDLLADAESGKLIGLAWVGEQQQDLVIHGKANVAIHVAIGFHMRAIHALQKDWDAS